MNNQDEWLKNFTEKYNRFHEEFEKHENVFKYNEQISFSQKGASDWAQIGVEQTFWMNGGALIALPAIAEAFDLNVNGGIIQTAILFSAGLVCTALCILFAYFSMARGADGLAYDRDESYLEFLIRHIRDFYAEETIESLETDKKKLEKIKKWKYRWSIVFEVFAILLALGSLACFVSGSLIFISSLNPSISTS